MKNVVIFQDFVNDVTYGHQWGEEELFNYFKAQIDNALRLGWSPEDIVICTNLDFDYKDVCIVKLDMLCRYNKYFNKQYGIFELLNKGILTEPFWFHDFDDWPLRHFDFPDFDGDIGMCKYIDFSQWNTGSIFVKPESKDIWELIIEFMDSNKKHPAVDGVGDENVVNLVYNIYEEIKERFSQLNTQYNVGVTQFPLRYGAARKPVNVGAFKPDDEKQFRLFDDKGLIDTELKNIFEKWLY